MIEAPVKLPSRMAGKNIKEHLKTNPEATEEELSVKFGCSKEYARQIVLQVFPEKSKWPKSRRKKYAAASKGKAQAKAKDKPKTESGAYPTDHSGRKYLTAEVSEADAHRRSGHMVGVFMSIQRLLSEGMRDIEKTIDNIGQMPENRQRIKNLLQHATILSNLLEPPSFEDPDTQREGHASVNAKVNLTKVK